MSRPTRRLRTRLLVAMVAIAFGVLVIAALGFGSFGFMAEIVVLLYPLARPYLPQRLRAMLSN